MDKGRIVQGRKSSVPTTKKLKVKGEKNLTRQHETKTKGLPEHTLAHSSAPCLPHHERIGDEYLSKLKNTRETFTHPCFHDEAGKRRDRKHAVRKPRLTSPDPRD